MGLTLVLRGEEVAPNHMKLCKRLEVKYVLCFKSVCISILFSALS
jgi:hypothetical protein